MTEKAANGQQKSSLLRRYGRWFSYGGAMIVFVTFVVKEGIGDTNKEFLDRLTSVQAEANTLRDHEEIMEAIRTVRPHNVDLSAEPFTQDWEGVEEIPTDYHAATVWQLENEQLRNDQGTRARMQTLADVIPQSGALNNALSNCTMHDASSEAAKNDQMLEGFYVQTGLIDPPKQILTSDQIAKIREAHRRWQFTYDHAMSECLGAENDVIAIALSMKDKKETEALHIKWLVWALYYLGWGLALLGHIYGGGDLPGGD